METDDTPDDDRYILKPFDPREAINAKQAAGLAGVGISTICSWGPRYGLGRKVAGLWHFSAPALAMFLDGNSETLALYHAGDRSSPQVRAYFSRCGVPLETGRAA